MVKQLQQNQENINLNCFPSFVCVCVCICMTIFSTQFMLAFKILMNSLQCLWETWEHQSECIDREALCCLLRLTPVFLVCWKTTAEECGDRRRGSRRRSLLHIWVPSRKWLDPLPRWWHVRICVRTLCQQSQKNPTDWEILKEERKRRRETSIPLSSCPLKWWRENSSQYPLLSPLAKACFSVPATSVQSERDFSTSGEAVGAQRPQLLPENVDCLYSRKRI